MAVNFLSIVYLCLLPTLVLGNLSLRQVPAGDDSITYQMFHVDSLIVARYAVTTITSVIQNRASVAQELNFQVQLPETAFISNFSMTVNDTTYYGIAEEKEKAQQEFDDRVAAGENVGLVEARATSVFRIRINTAANTQSTFALNYEELIVRRASKYTQTINLNPGQKVEDFRTTVHVIDEQGISTAEGSDYLDKEQISSQEVLYTYTPTVQEQNDEAFGLARDLKVEYDVTHQMDGPGLIVVNDCYFAQFFSPSGISSIPVDIVFVIDVSGSMSGTKIDQTREALETIVNQLRSTDRFTMVTFETTIFKWRSQLQLASTDNKQQGVSFARGLVADGGTNFNDGLAAGIEILRGQSSSSSIPLIVMLTDGEPTAGVTNEEQIISNAKASITGTRISLNCLGFGFSLNFGLLEKLALENNGIVRRIYEANDAAEQLEGFFEEISSPILHTININYPAEVYETISSVDFPLLFSGSELVVAGKFSAAVCTNPELVDIVISGTGATGQLTFRGQVDTGSNTLVAGQEPSTERLTAYLNIQQLLDKRLVADSDALKDELENEALSLALKYNFVTELTSLIVVQEGGNGNFTQGNNGLDNNIETEDIIALGGPGGGRIGGAVRLQYVLSYLVLMLIAATLINS